jgi:hypothetical protein
MYTSQIPGFTAESSAERKSVEYGFVFREITSGQSVQPAREIVWCDAHKEEFAVLCHGLGGGPYSTPEGCVGCSI